MFNNAFVLFLLIGIVFISNVFAQLDTSFDGDGKRYIQFNSSGATREMIVQPDHKILFLGFCNNIGTPQPFCAIRLNEDGSFDTTFGNGLGYVYAPISGTTHDISVRGGVLQSDGKIVLAGGGSRLVLTRLNPDGTTDLTFGLQGTVQNTSVSMVNRIALQPDGKFVVVGYSGSLETNSKQVVARFMPDGSRDAAFGSDGIVTLDIPLGRTRGESLDLQPDGKIITGGSLSAQTTYYLLTRFNRDGSLDTTFDGDGYLTIDTLTNYFPQNGYLVSVKVRPDGRIVVLGDGNVIYAFNADGSRDSSFNGIGARPAIPDCQTHAMYVSTSGKILVAGNLFPNGGNQVFDYRSARYKADGSIDTTYTGDEINIGGNDSATAILYDRKGRTLIGGLTAYYPPPVPFALPVFSAARLVAPPVQNVGFAGKVTNLNGNAVRNALITLKLDGNIVAYTRTNHFGNYRFQNIPTNQTYTVSTIAKSLKFYDRSVMIDDETANFLLVGE